MDRGLLDQRYALGAKQYLPQRFAKSPNITEARHLTKELVLSYAPKDSNILPLVEEPYRKAYAYARGWFDYRGKMALDLWMAPEVVDLQYMTCQPCDGKWFCAPGHRDGKGIILFVSPLSCTANSWPDRLAGSLGHEIAHHLLEKITHSTVLTMKRQAEQGLPMWLEEGICQVIQGELDPAFRDKCLKQTDQLRDWYDLEELWNDLSSCADVDRAYLQAYQQTQALIEFYGKAEMTRLLYHSASQPIGWNRMARKLPKCKAIPWQKP